MSKSKSLSSVLLAGICMLLLLSSCSSDSSSPTEPPNVPTIPTEIREGVLAMTTGSDLPAEQLTAVSFTDTTGVNADGSFSLNAPVATGYQIVFFNSRQTSQPVYLGLFDPATKKVAASDSSTALALTLINPYLAYADQASRQRYLRSVLDSPRYGQLVSLISDAHMVDASTSLDFDANPAIFQAAVDLAREAMQALGGARSLRTTAGDEESGPSMRDGPGGDVIFSNPTHVWYCAGVHPNNAAQSAIVPIDRIDGVVGYQWDWPPVTWDEPKETAYALGDGAFRLDLAKGLDYTKFTQTNDPAGRATILNTAQMALYIIDLAAGWAPPFQAAALVERSHSLHLSSGQVIKLNAAVAQGDYLKLLGVTCDILGSNADEVAYWIFQSTATSGARQWLASAGSLLKNVALVLKLYGAGNEQVPFFWDLIFAPSPLSFSVNQAGGTLSILEANDPPVAAFAVTPPAGTLQTVFAFDASATRDDHDALSALSFRWDFDGDGAWDTDWTSSVTATHQFTTGAAWIATMEARDSMGSIDTATHVVSVNGGSGTANHVKLFRDMLPWESSAHELVFRALGFTAGPGPNQYEIIPSDIMVMTPLVPGQDLVIVSNDQAQTFYDNYAATMIKFGNFALSGGSLFLEACDGGWNRGTMANAGVILPGDVHTNFLIDGWNYVVNPQLPIVAGLPLAMDHNYASHEWFSNLPEDATIYCVDGMGHPTLVEYNLGLGWVLMSGQPLEHQYDRLFGPPDMERLLPRIIAYFTGKTLTSAAAEALIARTPAAKSDDVRPSSSAGAPELSAAAGR